MLYPEFEGECIQKNPQRRPPVARACSFKNGRTICIRGTTKLERSVWPTAQWRDFHRCALRSGRNRAQAASQVKKRRHGPGWAPIRVRTPSERRKSCPKFSSGSERKKGQTDPPRRRRQPPANTVLSLSITFGKEQEQSYQKPKPESEKRSVGPGALKGLHGKTTCSQRDLRRSGGRGE